MTRRSKKQHGMARRPSRSLRFGALMVHTALLLLAVGIVAVLLNPAAEAGTNGEQAVAAERVDEALADEALVEEALVDQPVGVEVLPPGATTTVPPVTVPPTQETLIPSASPPPSVPDELPETGPMDLTVGVLIAGLILLDLGWILWSVARPPRNPRALQVALLNA